MEGGIDPELAATGAPVKGIAKRHQAELRELGQETFDELLVFVSQHGTGCEYQGASGFDLRGAGAQQSGLKLQEGEKSVLRQPPPGIGVAVPGACPRAGRIQQDAIKRSCRGRLPGAIPQRRPDGPSPIRADAAGKFIEDRGAYVGGENRGRTPLSLIHI